MNDFILDISYDSRDEALEELLQARLFMTASTGSSSSDANGTSILSAYFDSAEERDAAEVVLREVDGIDVQATERERLNWLDVYQQSLEPIVIGDRFLVVPDPNLIPTGTERHTIIVPQEQAFGTGSHETTALCIGTLEELDIAGKRGLDIGAGSGILAIAMLRLGAARAIAFDNDLDAYAALRDNRIRNGIDEAVMPLFIGSVEALRAGTFDVVTMNIIPEVILPLLPAVVPHLAEEAQLILSGILIVRRNDVVAAAARHGLHLTAERERGEWWAGCFGR
jgi:ribosomal protein L11 methyltransferase